MPNNKKGRGGGRQRQQRQQQPKQQQKSYASNKSNNSKIAISKTLKSSSSSSRAPPSPSEWNFWLPAGPGCHIARPDFDEASRWILEWESVDPQDFCASDDEISSEDDDDDDEDHEQSIPDIAIDPEASTLTVCNIRSQYVIAFLSVYNESVVLRDRHGTILSSGSTTDETGRTRPVTTLIVLCPPNTFAHLCYLDWVQSASVASAADADEHDNVNEQDEDADATVALDTLPIESDVQVWKPHPQVDDTYTGMTLGFPLLCCGDSPVVADDGRSAAAATPASAAYLCTQGEGGQLTHFFVGNYHAVDFACPVGTPVVAVADAVVVQVQAENTVTGIAVPNLFRWNSILLQVTVPPKTQSQQPEVEKEQPDESGNNNNISNPKDEDAVDNDHDNDGPLFVEYVHIQTAVVKVGDVVTAGQVLGTTGSVGFSPEPHLHLAAYRSADPTAPTVRVYFHATTQTTTETTAADPAASASTAVAPERSEQPLERFLPRAGCWYNATGLVDAPPTTCC